MIVVDLHTRVYRLADARDPKTFARIFVNAKTAVKRSVVVLTTKTRMRAFISSRIKMHRPAPLGVF